MRDRNRKGRDQSNISRRRDRSPDQKIEDEETVWREGSRKGSFEKKETSYQRRLQKWEDREMRKSREIDSRRRREGERREDEEKEAIRLKIFLQDYDDDQRRCQILSKQNPSSETQGTTD